MCGIGYSYARNNQYVFFFFITKMPVSAFADNFLIASI